jgi:hypothetical protein
MRLRRIKSCNDFIERDKNICDYVFNSEIIISRGIWMSFFAPKKHMRLCSLKVQIKAGDLPLRGFPVLRLWISLERMGARLDHREQAGSKHLPRSVEKKTSISLTI